MNLIIIHQNKNSTTNNRNGLLRFAVSTEPVAGIILHGLSKNLCWSYNSGSGKTACALPEEWNAGPYTTIPKIIPYKGNETICFEPLRKTNRKRTSNLWSIISNGRFATQIDRELLDKVLVKIQADVIVVNAEPELLAYREKMLLTTQGKVAGFRRAHADSAESTPIPTDWPHHIFVKTNVLDGVLTDHTLPQSFLAFLTRCRSNTLTLRAINLAGTSIDLETEEGLLNFCRIILSKTQVSKSEIRNSNSISPDAKFIGKVLLGKNIQIGPKVIIVGPTIISDNVKIASGAVINSSIIGPGVCVPQNQLIQNRVVKGPQYNWKYLTHSKNGNSKQIFYPKFNLNHQQRLNNTFRYWPRFFYAGSLKRVADFIIAIIVLILFAPIMPFIILAIKLNSPGPVFFKDKRQAKHGKEFYCLKFRTMVVGADKIQDKLRTISQVDGPQFKINNDPRISAVGRFLRNTYIDEIPQFFNVLLGQMSVVGPRPSPESENTLCPFWRDARLSVRPGITGLWQVCRTRQPTKDFQEWIHYDTKYVKNLSLRMDIWICWQTTKKLVKNFISQF